jgi:hypothetical protein
MKFHKYRLFALLVFVAQSMPCYSQAFAPLELAQEIFSKDISINIADHITGEYTGTPNGRDINENLYTKFTLLEQNENKAVIAMTIHDEMEKGSDYYLYFRKEVSWKMYALRSLALTGMIESMVTFLEQMTYEEIDSQINGNNDYSLFSSMDEYNYLLGNSRLILETDDNIIKHFMENRNKFEEIKDMAINELNEKYNYRNMERKIYLIQDFEPVYKKLYISSVSIGDIEFGFCLQFNIGGILDNTVGYVYTNDKTNLPEINPNKIIMIREIGNGWYIYKTT